MQAEKTEVIRTGITGSTLKIIAMITMLIDHIGATIVLQLVQRNSDNFDAFGNVRMTGMVILYYVLRGIGRLAFPIFIFLLLEGFQYTHNRFLYIGRLLLFAIISEIPFDLAVNLSTNSILKGHVLEFASQNVFFTLAIGMIPLPYRRRCLPRRLPYLPAWAAEPGYWPLCPPPGFAGQPRSAFRHFPEWP